MSTFLTVDSKEIMAEWDTHHEGNLPTKCKVPESFAAKRVDVHHRKRLASLFKRNFNSHDGYKTVAAASQLHPSMSVLPRSSQYPKS